jgi:hypothetical protein
MFPNYQVVDLPHFDPVYQGRPAAQTTLYTILEDEPKLKKAAYYADCKENHIF